MSLPAAADGPRWYHTIDLPDGSRTPGLFDHRAAADHVAWPASVAGGRCLDVGTFDGFWSFELERRGAAEVVAMDVDDPASLDWAFDHRRSGPDALRRNRLTRGPGFELAAELLGSAVKRIDRSVYDLDPATEGIFDVVVCGALLPHLRDPALALERMREVCASDGTLLLVEAIDDRLELLARRVPAARVVPWHDQWYRPNSAGLVQLVRTAGFEVRSVGKRFLMPLGPGAPADARQSALAGVLVGRPGRRGVLMRCVIATPRPPTDR